MRTDISIDGAAAFGAAARKVVDYLSRHTPLSDWSVSRVAGGEQVHVHVHHADFLDTGTRVAWQDSFCRQMTSGAAHVVPDSVVDPAYSHLPDAGVVRAYVGYPIADDDGELFGVLCGVDAKPLADASAVDGELVELGPCPRSLDTGCDGLRGFGDGSRELGLVGVRGYLAEV